MVGREWINYLPIFYEEIPNAFQRCEEEFRYAGDEAEGVGCGGN
jgi:hypothetical protein